MSDQSQPREFWINTITKEVHLGPLKGADGNVRVVEYSFLENAEAKIKALEEADENRIDLNLHVSLMEEIAKARDQLKSEIEAQAQQLASLRAENEKLKSQTPTFIKMDETTEAFQQTRAAIENMKMFQKDAILLRNDLAQAKNEIHRLQYEVTKTHGEAYHQGLNDRQDEIDSLKVELAKANTKEFAANLKIDELKAKLEALTKQHENCISMDVHLPLVEAMAKERDALKSKLEAAEKEIEQWQNDDVKADEAFRALNDELKILQAEVERLVDENASLVSDLEGKSKEIGRSEHRGNTVDYIYDKCETYGRQVQELAKLIDRYRTALEFYADDETWAEPEDSDPETGYFPPRGCHPKEIAIEALASTPETGPSKDAVIERLVEVLSRVQKSPCVICGCTTERGFVNDAIEAAKGTA